jgi:hypothetical protein
MTNLAPFFDMGLRLLITFVKGIFIFILAKNLPDIEFGMYVALTANVAIFQYFVAGDYSYIMHRHYFLNKFEFIDIVSTQKIIFILLFLISIPIYILLLPGSFDYFILFLSCAVLFLETITSEIQRHLVALSKFTSAILVMFLKSAAWMAPMIAVFFNDFAVLSFVEVISIWAIGAFLSL